MYLSLKSRPFGRLFDVAGQGVEPCLRDYAPVSPVTKSVGLYLLAVVWQV